MHAGKTRNTRYLPDMSYDYYSGDIKEIDCFVDCLSVKYKENPMPECSDVRV